MANRAPVPNFSTTKYFIRETLVPFVANQIKEDILFHRGTTSNADISRALNEIIDAIVEFMNDIKQLSFLMTSSKSFDWEILTRKCEDLIQFIGIDKYNNYSDPDDDYDTYNNTVTGQLIESILTDILTNAVNLH